MQRSTNENELEQRAKPSFQKPQYSTSPRTKKIMNAQITDYEKYQKLYKIQKPAESNAYEDIPVQEFQTQYNPTSSQKKNVYKRDLAVE